MGKTTDIAWTDHTFNPWIGCAPAQHPSGPVAQGCVNCYAATLNKRFRWAHTLDGDGKKVPAWGKGAPRKLASESTWKQVEGWARSAAKAGVRRSVFFSLGDPLDQEVPEEWRARLWSFIRATARLCSCGWPGPQRAQCDLDHRGGLDWLLLTKRPWLWKRIPEDVRPLIRLGTSASDQQSWDLWVGDLVKARGFAGLFVSLEPQVADVADLRFGATLEEDEDSSVGCVPCDVGRTRHEHPVGSGPCMRRVGWVIQGGESGPKARPFRLEWARSVRDQCRAAGVRFFMKQVGSRPYPTPGFDEWPRGLPEDSAGADPSEWPEDLRVRELPW